MSSTTALYAGEEILAAFAAEHSYCEACGNSGAIDYADGTPGPCPCNDLEGISADDL